MGVSDFASKATVNSIAQIALQGRKYNIGFIVIAQRTANVSKTVLTQCNSIIAFKSLDKTSCDFLSNYMGQEFINTLPSLKFRTALAVGKAFKSTVPMIFEVPEIEESEYVNKNSND
jgi:DNA helicase HerA-like ATPase